MPQQPRQAPIEPHYTPEQVAELLQVSARTLERWRAQRIGPPYVKIGHFVRYPQSAVGRYLAQQTQDSAVSSNLIDFAERRRRG